MTFKIWIFGKWRGPIHSNKTTNDLIDALFPIYTTEDTKFLYYY